METLKEALEKRIKQTKDNEERIKNDIQRAKDEREREAKKKPLLPFKAFLAMHRINPNYHGRFRPAV